MSEAMSGLFAEQIGAMDKVKDVFFTTNLLFSLLLIIFVVFFCIRSVSSTKTSLFFLLTSVVLFTIYSFLVENELYVAFNKQIFPTFEGQTGCMLCTISFILLFLGLRDEEITKEYVHSRFHWGMIIVVTYIGLFMISLSITVKQVLALLGA